MQLSGTTFTLDLNDREITAALRDAFQEANEKFSEEAQREITSKKWDWPEPGSDIVDRGQLRDSYAPSSSMDGLEVTHAWTAEHAMANHEGAKYADGHTRPGRPWTKAPITKFERNFDAVAKVKLGRIK